VYRVASRRILSSSDFRHIAHQGASDRAERLFRASITAYCSLAHPTRNETVQLEVLTMPLYELVSDETRRYVAAALSECAAPPPGLVRRLCDERPEVSAPLLVRSTALSDLDLVALVARHGDGHARAIARRKNLHPAIDLLVKVVLRPEAGSPSTGSILARRPAPSKAETPAGSGAEAVRSQLRSMMHDPDPPARPYSDPVAAYQQMRAAALAGDRPALTAALQSSLDVSSPVASAMLETPGRLTAALRALSLTGEQALLIAICVAPGHFSRLDAIETFVSRFAGLGVAAARLEIDRWRDKRATLTVVSSRSA
jgi:uncharacterized protein (DUF2336 family)